MTDQADNDANDGVGAVASESPDKHEHSPHAGRKAKHLAPAACSTLAMLIAVLFLAPCMCGYLRWDSLPFTALAVALACYGWVASTAWLPFRLLQIVVVIAAVLVFAKNIADVLWFGHNPVW